MEPADGQTFASTTLANSNTLQFAIGANDTWTFQATLVVQAGAVGAGDGIAIGFSVPSGAAITFGENGPATGSTSNTGVQGSYEVSTSGATPVDAGAPSSGYAEITVSGTVTGGGTAGNVVMQFGMAATGTNSVTIAANSYLIAEQAAS